MAGVDVGGTNIEVGLIDDQQAVHGRAKAPTPAGGPDEVWKTSLFDIRDHEDKATLTSKVWAKALDEDDALATKLFDRAIETLGIAVGSAINLPDLEVVVVGGGLADSERIMRRMQIWNGRSSSSAASRPIPRRRSSRWPSRPGSEHGAGQRQVADESVAATGGSIPCCPGSAITSRRSTS